MITGHPTPAVVPVPDPVRVRDVFAGLAGRQVQVGPAAPVLPGHEVAVVAAYLRDDGAIGAVLACELELAAGVAAALGVLPVATARACLTAGCLSDELADNFREVANVLSSGFNDTPGTPHVRLDGVHGPDEPLDHELGRVLRYVMRRLDLRIDIAGYGGGRLSVVSVG